ncbi:dTMP kinase [Mariniluteicoccus flavus]
MTGLPGVTGLFVVFEGGDGAGKSTQVSRLAQWLAAEGREVVVTHEPGDSAVGRRIRELVLDPATGDIDPRAEALLYAADKAQHLFEVVRPALERGAVVVCDRYVDSMVAYQGAGRVLAELDVATVAGWATAHLLPDLTVVLDADPADAVARKADKDRLEGAGDEFHGRVREGFLRLAAADPDRYLVLPARDSREAIEQAVRARVRALLSGAGHEAGVAEELSEPSGTMNP